MIEVSYYATEKGYVIEAIDRSHPGDILGNLLHDRRVHQRGSQNVLSEIALQEAAEIASLCGVPLSAIIYDTVGERDERALFG